jgi:hypothetical protein
MSTFRKLITAAGCAACLAACESSPPTSLPASPHAPRAAAGTTTVSENFPVSGTIFNDCTGEDLAYSGSFHTVFHVTTTANGGFHVVAEGNASRIKGVGLTSGIRYTGTQAETDVFNITAATEETATFTFKAIAQGSAPDQTVQALFHITIDANGTVTVLFDEFRSVCR